MARQYELSPFGIAVHPWINKPDTKFNPDGVFKFGLNLSGLEAVAFKEKVDAEAQAAFDRYWETDDGKKVPAKDRKQWKVYVPYTVDEDDAGNPTGYIVFDFKQNAKIKLRDGTVKEVTIGVKDAKNNPMHRPIYGGTDLRAMFSFRDIPMKSLKQIGTRLDFAQVQVRKLAESTGPGFGEVEGYVESGDEGGHSGAAPSTDVGGDY